MTIHIGAGSVESRAVILPKTGSPDVLRLERVTTAPPDKKQVRIRVHAAGVVFSDILLRKGFGHPGIPKPPLIMGQEVAGVIDAVGDETPDALPVGTPVIAATLTGGYADYIVTDMWRCIPFTDVVSPTDAVCLTINYWAARHMVNVARVQAGQTILVHGAAGGLGQALLQLARLLGVRVIGTASAKKHAAITTQGAIPIDYRTEDFVARTKALTNGEGVHAAFDPIGGRNWLRSYQTLRRGGILIMNGYHIVGERGIRDLPLTMPLIALRRLFSAGRQLITVHLAPEEDYESYKAHLPVLVSQLAEGKIKPHIAAVLPLEKAAEAHRMLEAGEVVGKIVLATQPIN